MRGWLCVLSLTFAAFAAAPLRADAPRFAREIVPLFSRLGCNGGGCHGAVQGKNGFRLSLFGNDPVADHRRIVQEAGGRRLNLADPAESLLLTKGAAQISHRGGRKLAPGSPEYLALERWIAAGAPLDDVGQSVVDRLEIAPVEQVGKPGQTYPLRVTAHFADGSQQDVTALCVFDSRDTAVAEVNAQGQVTVRAGGDTALVARYRARPVVATVLVPGGEPRPLPSDVRAVNFVDERILEKLGRLGLPPAPLCDDETFLRRACLDVTGALPAPDEVRAFLADTAADKRGKKIDELLARPGHTALWATKFCDLMRVRISYQDFTHQPAPAAVKRYYDWVRARLAENTPYDQFVERMLLATSADGRSRDAWREEVLQMVREDQAPAHAAAPASGGYAQRQSLDLFWHRFDSAGVKGAVQFSHAFLGLRLQCAQCHRHPSDVWTQDDLLSFANYFQRLRGNTGVLSVKEASDVKKAAGGGVSAEEKKKFQDQTKELQDQAKKLEDQAKAIKDNKEEAEKLKAQAKELTEQAGTLTRALALWDCAEVFVTPGQPLGFARVTSPLGTQESSQFRLLGDPSPESIANDEDPRSRLMGWLRRPDNPFFAKAIVNRVWAHYFGRGLVEPADDLSPLNPPSHPQLLAQLGDEFVRRKYDLRWLHRTLLETRAWQQASRPSAGAEGDARNYAFYYPRRLMAEIVVDNLHQATGTSEKSQSRTVTEGMRALEIPVSVSDNAIGSRFVEFAFVVLGRPLRSSEAVCDCEREGQPSLQQALFLANHPEIWKKITAKEGRLTKLLADRTEPGTQIEEVFLWTLGRLPTSGERELCQAHLQSAATPRAGLEGVLWSLLNSKEFVINH